MSLTNKLPLTKIKIRIARVLYRVVKLFNRSNEKEITRNGIRFRIDLSEGIDLSLYLFGNFQSHVSRNKFIHIPADGIIFDVGANIGVMALQFAQTVPQGKVYAFEPTHAAYKRLQENIALNPDLGRRIQTTQTFVSSGEIAEENMVAYASWKVGGSKSNLPTHPVHLGQALSTENVGTITLDDFVEAHAIPRLDLIKIDTDGHEPEVLRGARRTLEKLQPKVIFEIGQYVMTEKNISFDFYLDLFGALGYELVNSSDGKSVTKDNWSQVIPKWGTIDLLARPVSSSQSHS